MTIYQGRLFSYNDTHRHRLGANWDQIPVNCPYRWLDHQILDEHDVKDEEMMTLMFILDKYQISFILCRAGARNYQRDGPMTVSGNQVITNHKGRRSHRENRTFLFIKYIHF